MSSTVNCTTSANLDCPHCGENVAKKTYLAHKRLYFDSESGNWVKKRKLTPNEDCFVGMEFEEGCHHLVEHTEAGDIDNHGAPPILDFGDSEPDCEGDHEWMIDDQGQEVETSSCSDSNTDDEQEEMDGEEVWEMVDSDDDEDVLPDLESSTSGTEVVLLTWLLLFLLRLQAKHYIPDVALNSLLKFLYAFLVILSQYSDFVQRIVTRFPNSVHGIRKFFELKEEFTRYVVCRKCYSVYSTDSCKERCGRSLVSKRCSHRDHPNSRLSCNTILLKSVTLLNGTKKLYPFKVYCYGGLQRSLQRLLDRPGFTDKCEHWRNRTSRHDGVALLQDIYDGQLWKDFQHVGGKPCLAAPYVYAMMLNVDWFQPYKLTQSSVGAIYLTIMNLPYEERFKRENVILIGIIPGPSEPERDINQYLRPLVKELLVFYTGVEMRVHGQIDQQTVRCVLFGIACDLPAGRKASGFLGHSATLGCTRCFKKFPGSVGCKDYSGFDRQTWKSRTNSNHRSSIKKIQEATTKTKRNELESKYGCRYSVLLNLPYYDPVRMLIIDPMHNLFLGSAKHIVKKVWSNNDVLDLSKKDVCNHIQNIVDSIQVPQDIGRIPRKVETGFSGLTADQYKNWVTLYSIPCLFGVIDSDDLECWRHFVLACRLLCQRSLSLTDINLADGLLVQFCRRVQRMYGSSAITPNMHMHCHLKEVILDYGPVYGFWLFSYERYNGIMQHQPTSNHCVEIQIMKRFIQDNTAYAFQPPTEFSNELGDLCNLQQRVTGSLLLMQSANERSDLKVEIPLFYTRCTLAEDERQTLKNFLSTLHSKEVEVNSLYCRYKFVLVNGRKFLTTSSKRLSVVMANFNTVNSDTLTPRQFLIPGDISLRVCRIDQFLKVSYTVDGAIYSNCFAKVSWYQLHPSRYLLGKPVEICCQDFFESDSFLSINHTYMHQCVHTNFKLPDTEENVLVVIPCVS